MPAERLSLESVVSLANKQTERTKRKDREGIKSNQKRESLLSDPIVMGNHRTIVIHDVRSNLISL